MRLRSYDVSPPGGFPFEQDGSDKFATQPMIEAQARIVQAYRKGNGLARSSYAECVEDVDRYQCQRLGNNPTFCIECNPDDPHGLSLPANAPGLAPCAGCGARIE